MADETVSIEIVASQRVDYHQRVTLTRERWERLKADPKVGDRDGPLTDFLDLMRPIDSGEFEIHEITAVDSNGKALVPRDEWRGDLTRPASTNMETR